MKRKKTTRRALVSSIVSLLMCMAMLIGTTFAWFTDTASTAVNRIQSGTLKVKLVDENGNELRTALNWEKAEGHEDEEVLWEPGATYNLQKFRVVNDGNLALKYKIIISGIQSGDAELLNALDFTFTENKTVIDGETEIPTQEAYDLDVEHHLKAEEQSGLITISAQMKKEARNEYQNKSIEGITITVVATQDTIETDSNSNEYDKDALYPNMTISAVAKENDTVIIDAETNITVTAPLNSLSEEISSVALSVESITNPANISIEDTQTASSYEIALKDQFGNVVSAQGSSLFTVEMNIGANRTMLKVYHNGNLMTNDGTTLTNTADHYVYDSASGVVTMKVDSFSPFSAVYNKDKWGSDTAASDYKTPVDTAQKVVTISSAEELALFATEVTDNGKNYSGYTVNITADIDLSENLWKPINGSRRMSGITINGNGHTIRNMMVRNCTNASGYGAGFIGDTAGAITIKNLNFDGADVFFVDYAKKRYYGNVGGIVMGYTYGTTVFENVSVTNSEIWGYGKIGIMLGMGADPGVSVTFKDCVSKNNTINAAYDMGGLAGMIQRKNGVDNGKVENCTVENITVNYYPDGSYVDVKGLATFKSNDQASGEDVKKEVAGKYFDEAGYYWCAYGDYYVSYGSSSYDAPVEGYEKCLANSEYSVNVGDR